MAENSNIEWTTSTFNPWRGCTKISAGCAHCYAETLSGRNPKMLGVWGPNGTRVVASEAMWREPVKWNHEAKKAHDYWACGGGKNKGPAPERPRVFCASLADVFEDWQGPMMGSGDTILGKDFRASSGPADRLTMQDVRVRLFRLIDATPNLDWLILTKRPENVGLMPPYVTQYIPEAGEMSYQEGTRPNVWLGVSVENQAAADDRIPHLMRTPAAVRFLSCEPLLGPVDLGRIKHPMSDPFPEFAATFSCLTLEAKWADNAPKSVRKAVGRVETGKVDWVIVGGESGGGARPMNVEWARSIAKQCKAAGVACFVKQLGAAPFIESQDSGGATHHVKLFMDKKGGDIAEFPEDLRVREYPARSQ